jgi:hypothetical protein
MTARLRRWTTLALAPIAAAAFLLAPGTAAHAAPKPDDPAVADEGSVEDNDKLRDVLETTGRKFVEANDAKKKSEAEQRELEIKVKDAESKRDALLPQVRVLAGRSYRTPPLSGFGLILSAGDSSQFLKQFTALSELNQFNDDKLKKFQASIDDVSKVKARLDQEVAVAQQKEETIGKLKKEADQAISLVGGKSFTGGLVDFKSPKAAPTRRAADGSLPGESCSVDDPTTGGCITPRTFHMYKEVRRAGFNRFVGCHRSGGPFEHPKGRACDWSLQKSGFSSWHNEDTRTYGNNLMAFLVRNADALGVLYVIWNKQIWQPAIGWKSYSGASDHTDHVHVSML